MLKRAKRDRELTSAINRVFAGSFAVYGARKVLRQLHREGFYTVRCGVERLMKTPGLQGVICGKVLRTTISDKGKGRLVPGGSGIPRTLPNRP